MCHFFRGNFEENAFALDATECVTELDEQTEKNIFGSILTTFEISSIFGGSWSSIENWLQPKTRPPLENLACPNQ